MARTTTQLKSSSLRSVSYDPDTRELGITFINGRTYLYPDVPPDIFERLSNDTSPGTFFNQNIKGRFG